jgi:hypothetical protein
VQNGQVNIARVKCGPTSWERIVEPDERKAAIAAYKRRTAVAGIYALRCIPSGQVWVGQAADIDAIGNRVAFMLRTGNDPHRSFEAAWKAHGPQSFVLETLERLVDEELPYVRQAQLKARAAHWRTQLGAEAI